MMGYISTYADCPDPLSLPTQWLSFKLSFLYQHLILYVHRLQSSHSKMSMAYSQP